MALKALKKLITTSFELNQVQANLDQLVTQLNFNPFVTGQWLQAQKLNAAAATTLQHGLGRAPSGWIITNTNGAATIYQVVPSVSAPNPTPTTLKLFASSAVTVDIWIF